jgi:hypothetical protein
MMRWLCLSLMGALGFSLWGNRVADCAYSPGAFVPKLTDNTLCVGLC